LNAGINRRQLLKAGGGIAAAAVGANLLAACGSSGNGTSGGSSGPALSGGPSVEGSPVKGGTLRVGLVSAGSAETIDPKIIANTPDMARGANLYDTLFLNAPGGVEPGLAVSAEPNKDATVWTFKLRDDVTFHNGKPFTADDVIYTMQKSWGAEDSYQYAFASSVTDLKNLRKIDRLTVEIPLLRPVAQFPTTTSFQNTPIIPAGTTDFQKGVGTGPFKLDSFTPGKISKMSANADYWGGAPHVDELIIDSSFTDDAARLNAVLSGGIHIAPSAPPALAQANANSSDLVLANVQAPQFVAIVLRVSRPPFNDPRVIQALKLLTDRESVVSDAFSGYAEIGNDSPPATLEYFASDIRPEYDPEKAKSLLKQAGQEDLSFPLVTAPTLPGMVETGTLWSAQAAEVGLDFPVKQVPLAVMYNTAQGYMDDSRPVSMTFWNNMPSSMSSFFLSAYTPDAVYPETGWGSKPSQVKLIDEALAEMDTTKAEEKWHAAQEQQIKEGGYIVPANPNYLDAYSPAVRGLETTSAGPCANYAFRKAWLES